MDGRGRATDNIELYHGIRASGVTYYNCAKAHSSIGNQPPCVAYDRAVCVYPMQITGDFTRAEIPNIESAKDKDTLEKFFIQDQRKILITTIFKFGDVQKMLSDRSNIIVMVDEAHRTQEKDLGAKMRLALPNVFFFGLTGTPINRHDHNTFAAFGAEESRYMSKYTFQDSVADGATLELNFKTVPVEMHLDDKKLQAELYLYTILFCNSVLRGNVSYISEFNTKTGVIQLLCNIAKFWYTILSSFHKQNMQDLRIKDTKSCINLQTFFALIYYIYVF